jgi:heterodisulfide reductase subunit B
MCHSNLDFRQQTMTRGGEEPLPVLYVTQLVGLAMGIEADALGLDRHFVGTGPIARAIGGPLPAGRN